jgi:hypothetical protein
MISCRNDKNYQRYFFFLALLILSSSAYSQEFQFERLIKPFDIYDQNGSAFEFPFFGGLNGPRVQFLDLDDDGDQDLFIQEEIGRISFFKNMGSPELFKFEWQSDNFQDINVGAWFLFRDMDHDGDFDLMGESLFSQIKYFKNVGSSKFPNLIAAMDTLFDVDANIIFASRASYPELADIDCDDDLDLFLGNSDGSISFFENLGLDADSISTQTNFMTC